MSKEIAVGVIGAGFGRYGLIPAFSRDPRFRLVAVCSQSLASASKMASARNIVHVFDDFSKMLARVPMDAVAVATPPSVQEAISRAALDAGIAVFAEKPLALTLRTAKDLLARAQAAAVAHAVDFMFPELETWRRARALIQDGVLGGIRHVMVDWRMESYDTVRRNVLWKTDAEQGGGGLSHFGSHAFYNLEWLAGQITGLTAHLSTAPDLDASGDTLATIAVAFASGATGSLSISTAALHGSGHRVEIYGENGTLVLANDMTDPVLGFRLLCGRRDVSGIAEVAREIPDQGVAGEDHRVAPVSRLVSRFLTAVSGGPRVCPSFADGVRVQTLIEAARSSNETNAWIDTPHGV
jgi:predicted dehydrogenase